MATKDSLGDRMKENYENRSKTYLTRRLPVIIRLDGCHFHTFTRGFDRPYDKLLHEVMEETLLYLCRNIQGCKFGYTQSDEITLVLTDYDTLTTDAWFGYSVQKICSVAASMATYIFNKYFEELVNKWHINHYGIQTIDNSKAYRGWDSEKNEQLYSNYLKSLEQGAFFDARAFNIPEDEVTNCIIWRQQDATRNAIQMLGQANFSHNELQGKSCNDIQDMLMLNKNINFNDMPTQFKRGTACFKKALGWHLDYEMPIITQDRDYVEKHIHIKEV